MRKPTRCPRLKRLLRMQWVGNVGGLSKLARSPQITSLPEGCPGCGGGGGGGAVVVSHHRGVRHPVAGLPARATVAVRRRSSRESLRRGTLLREARHPSDAPSLIPPSSTARIGAGATTALGAHVRLRKSVVINRQVPDVVPLLIEPP